MFGSIKAGEYHVTGRILGTSVRVLACSVSKQLTTLTSNSQVHLLRVAVLPEVSGQLEDGDGRRLRDLSENGHGSGEGGGNRCGEAGEDRARAPPQTGRERRRGAEFTFTDSAAEGR